MAKEVAKTMIGSVKRRDFNLVYGLVGASSDAESYMKEEERLLEVLTTDSNHATRDSPVGFLLRFPVADGCAFYRVESVKPLTVQHVPYADAWRIPAAHIRGIRIGDVLRQIKQRDFWKKPRK
jgi:hypothetical protein